MKGSYQFRVKSKKVIFEFSIRRNITVIKGNSATGKSTLLHMLYEYLRAGKQSGYSVTTNGSYYVYLRDEVGRDWKDALYGLKDTIIFIEENNEFVFGKEFAAFVQNSGNYFVLVTRSPLNMLPYSIHEIYEIQTDRKNADVKESYHEFKEIYSNYPIVTSQKAKNIVVEDSKAGYQFFSEIFPKRNVISADGNGNIIKTIRNVNYGDVLVIADGAAFGCFIENCLAVFETIENKRVTLWLPESFEYLILRSGVVESGRLKRILENPSEYIDCKDYISWERFFTKTLVELTCNSMGKYSKDQLNPYYLQDWAKKKIIDQIPEEIAGDGQI